MLYLGAMILYIPPGLSVWLDEGDGGPRYRLADVDVRSSSMKNVRMLESSAGASTHYRVHLVVVLFLTVNSTV
jgi:hypothetical protein